MDGEKILDPDTWRWVRARAARDYGGDWRLVVAEALERMRAAETLGRPVGGVGGGAGGS